MLSEDENTGGEHKAGGCSPGSRCGAVTTDTVAREGFSKAVGNPCLKNRHFETP